ncbi:MAG: helix-turn-helix domain-containing protein [Gammaproteobacteria bacterium]|nr:helix-turn-helix domain-containing protein [Gammaproteobacteria bacterium]
MAEVAPPFSPDWISPPGDTILDLIEEKNWTQMELARRMGYSPKHVNRLVKGKVALTEDTAILLERVLGAGAQFWLAREARYRERIARRKEATAHAGWVPWLDELPVRELMKTAGGITTRRIDAKSKPSIVGDCLRFFGVASPSEWRDRYGEIEASFRRRTARPANVGAIAAWLRLGERQAETLGPLKYHRGRFETALYAIREFTTLEPDEFQPRLEALLEEAGVGLVLTAAVPGAGVSGAARWLGKSRPLIQLSLYGRTNDKFWFTFFHEAAHLLLHAADRNVVWLDDVNGTGGRGAKEDEADAWAANLLIPSVWSARLSGIRSKALVREFARETGVHPAIVVGRLQHDGIVPFTHMNEFKVSYSLEQS